MKVVSKVFLLLLFVPSLAFAGFDGALIKLQNDQNVPGSVQTVMDWDMEIYDTNDFHDDTLNLSRLTVPEKVKFVRLCTSVVWESNFFGHRNVHLTKNGVRFEGGMFNSFNNAPFVDFSGTNCSAIVPVVEGDYFEVVIAHWVGGMALDILSVGETWFSIEVID